jgi:hypothetical protein
MDQSHEAAYRLEMATAGLNYSLRVFGDHLAQTHGFKVHRGLDAVCYYVIQKYNWLPRDVRTMSSEDLRFLLEEEMSDWILPPESRPSS